MAVIGRLPGIAGASSIATGIVTGQGWLIVVALAVMVVPLFCLGVMAIRRGALLDISSRVVSVHIGPRDGEPRS